MSRVKRLLGLIGESVREFRDRYQTQGWESARRYAGLVCGNARIQARNRREGQARVQCPCCGWEGYGFLAVEAGEKVMRDEQCPRCLRHSWHRLLYLYLCSCDREVLSMPGRGLFVGPEDHIRALVAENDRLSLVAVSPSFEGARSAVGPCLQSDPRHLAFPDQTFDVVFCLDLLEGVEADRPIIEELYRVLKPGATAYITVPSSVTWPKTFGFQERKMGTFSPAPGHSFRGLRSRLEPFLYNEIVADWFLDEESMGRHGLTPETPKLYRCLRPVQPPPRSLPEDFDDADVAVWKAVAPYTMTSPDRVCSLSRAVEYVIQNGIPGDFVECGVWKGGSAMAIALTLVRLGDTSRKLYLYDTYDEGWPSGAEEDVTRNGVPAHQLWVEALERGETPDTLFAKFDAVRDAVRSTGYPEDKVFMIKGKVEDTIPGVAPERIALLRLDTDWYASTRHELEQLFPRLALGGVLIVDDYGLWKGSQKATDTYFAEHQESMFLHRVDAGGCRIGIKR